MYTRLPRNREEVRVLGMQLLRSGTSFAAHIREASRARSSAGFCSKLEGALQEADEAQLWIELLREDCGINDDGLPDLHCECGEVIAICSTMVRKSKLKDTKR